MNTRNKGTTRVREAGKKTKEKKKAVVTRWIQICSRMNVLFALLVMLRNTPPHRTREQRWRQCFMKRTSHKATTCEVQTNLSPVCHLLQNLDLFPSRYSLLRHTFLFWSIHVSLTTGAYRTTGWWDGSVEAPANEVNTVPGARRDTTAGFFRGDILMRDTASATEEVNKIAHLALASVTRETLWG